MGARPKWWHILQGSRTEAVHAVDLYNRAVHERSLEAFVVHMNLAWLYLMHAKFMRDGVDFREWHGRRLVYIDGDAKTWGLGMCIAHEFDASSPVRANVEFFIKIRNKIEHRYSKVLAHVLAGKTQALVFNYEQALVDWFGPDESLGESLRFPVFLSAFTPDAVDAMKRAYKALPRGLTTFLRDQDAAVTTDVAEDWRYDFRVLLVPQTGPKTEADAVVRFVREDELTPDQRGALDVVQTIVRHKEVPVQNKGLLRPQLVAKFVSANLGVRFSTHLHMRAWKYYEVRPPAGAANPAETDPRYCLYDERHQDYGYTNAWVKMLVRKLKDPDVFEEVTGTRPVAIS